MKRIVSAVGVSLFASVVSAAPIVYEPFNYDAAPKSGGTGGQPGSFVLNGKSPDGGAHTWAATNTAAIRTFDGACVAGSLVTPTPLPPEQGNSLVFGGQGEAERINIGSFSSLGTIYYSMMVQVQTFAQTGTKESLLCGYNGSTGTATGASNPSAGALFAKESSPGKYQLGVNKSTAASSSATPPAYFPTEFDDSGTPVFVVVKYDYGAGSSTNNTDAKVSMWINPDPASFFGAEPAADESVVWPTINDASAIQSFELYQTGGTAATSSPGNTHFDEIRVDTTWGGVTPEPGSLCLLGVAAGGLVMRRRRTR